MLQSSLTRETGLESNVISGCFIRVLRTWYVGGLWGRYTSIEYSDSDGYLCLTGFS